MWPSFFRIPSPSDSLLSTSLPPSPSFAPGTMSSKIRHTIVSTSRAGIQRMFSLSKKPSRKLQPPNPAKTVPVSSLTTTAQSAADAIHYIPDTDIKTEVNILLEVIKRIDSKNVGDEKTRAQLEDLVRYLVELLEPLVRMRPSQITPDLRHEIHTLAEELHPISALNLDPEPSGTLRRRLSIINRLRNYDEEVYVFTQDLKMALDRFRIAALPMYPTSNIEMTMLSLGLTTEFSRPGLLPFLNAVVSHQGLIDYRLGTVQSIRLYRGNRPGHAGLHEFLLVGLQNKRGIENWVRLEPRAGLKRGEVDFATKPEKLLDDTAASRERIIVGDQLLMTRLATEIKAICENGDTSKYSARTLFRSLASHGQTLSTSISTHRHGDLFALPLPPLRDSF